MGTTLTLFAVGLAGSFVFDRFDLPGGAMTGAMIAVVIFKSCGSITAPDMTHWVRFLVYGCVGVIVGNMYNPGMLDAVRETWPMMLLSTCIILLAGLLCTWIAVRWGGLSVWAERIWRPALGDSRLWWRFPAAQGQKPPW